MGVFSHVRALGALALLSVTFLTTNDVSAQAASLFRDVEPIAETYSQPDEVKRFRYVGIIQSALPNAVSPAVAKPEVKLPLFLDASFVGVVEDVQDIAGGKAWVGRLKGEAASSFSIVSVGNVFRMHIASPEGVFEVSWVADGVYRIVELDHSKFRDHPEGAYRKMEIGEDPGAGDKFESAEADSDKVIDILVAYTNAARAAAGGTDQIKALIALALVETNQSYAKSGVVTSLRLLHVEEYTYAESGNLDTDLTRLVTTGDGYFENIHDLRDLYGADMVGLIVENGGAYCGLARGIYPGASKAFQVTARNCATGYYSFGHEFGHLQGARHDTYVDPSTTPYSYGHGYTDPQAPAPWRTVMAYNNRCSEQFSVNCTRLNYWSNPSIKHDGRKTGNRKAKNFRVLKRTDYAVANYRTKIIAGKVNSSFNDAAGRKNWKGKSGSWSICKSKYLCSNGIAASGAWAAYKAIYGDVTFTVRMKRTGACETCANRFYIRGDSAAIAASNWPRPTYAFQYTNTGSCSVYEVTEGGSFLALMEWTSCSALRAQWNRLQVVAVGQEMKFYINNSLVWSGSDDTLRIGEVGIGFYRDNDGPGKLFADWAQIRTTPTASTSDLPADEVVAELRPAAAGRGGDYNRSPR